MRQKFGAHDTSLQLMNKRQEDIKASLDCDLKSLSDQVRKNIYQDQFKKISLMLSTLPEQIEASLMKLQIELCNIFAKEMQAMSCSLRSPNRNGQRTGRCSTRQKKPQSVKGPTVPPKLCVQSIEVPKVELGGSVKKERATFKRRIPDKKHKQKGTYFLLKDNEIKLMEDVKEETERMLRRARRQKRQYSNPIIID
ncbi:hypothetical protein ACOSQ3_001009 [Xanthoceras sorbifolium]